MNKRELTWKYFWEQKGEEINNLILILAYIGIGLIMLFFIPIWIGGTIGDGQHVMCGDNDAIVQECELSKQWLEGFLYILVLFVLLMVVLCILLVIYDWLESNWERAERRAREEMKKSRSKKK